MSTAEFWKGTQLRDLPTNYEPLIKAEGIKEFLKVKAKYPALFTQFNSVSPDDIDFFYKYMNVVELGQNNDFVTRGIVIMSFNCTIFLLTFPT